MAKRRRSEFREKISDKIWLPPSPHEIRMSRNGLPVLPDEHSSQGQLLKRAMEQDLSFQFRLRELEESRHSRQLRVVYSCSGLQMGQHLRSFFLDYAHRILNYGFDSLPTSFNVVEAFLDFKPHLLLFDLRDEIEHLLSIDDYLNWYEEQESLAPQIIVPAIEEGKVYSYDFRIEQDCFRVKEKSEKRIVGISFVRHGNELSCMLLAGERPPLISDYQLKRLVRGRPTKGREKIKSDPMLSIESRYVESMKGYAKVTALMRFDLNNCTRDVRYVLADNGSNFAVFTDDREVFDDIPIKRRQSMTDASYQDLLRYDSLCSLTASLVYLPVFWLANAASVESLDVQTEIAELPDCKEATTVSVKCIPSVRIKDDLLRKVTPPEFEFKTDGYWKPIGLHQIGKDREGKATIGRTWVSRHEQWSENVFEETLISRVDGCIDGPDPGTVYVQRCAAHAAGVYKIGLTRRTAEQRAKDLSGSTSAPLPFDVIASFLVGNCSAVESMIHKRLARFRVNPKREFFRGELSMIIESLRQVVEEVAGK